MPPPQSGTYVGAYNVFVYCQNGIYNITANVPTDAIDWPNTVTYLYTDERVAFQAFFGQYKPLQGKPCSGLFQWTWRLHDITSNSPGTPCTECHEINRIWHFNTPCHNHSTHLLSQEKWACPEDNIDHRFVLTWTPGGKASISFVQDCDTDAKNIAPLYTCDIFNENQTSNDFILQADGEGYGWCNNWPLTITVKRTSLLGQLETAVPEVPEVPKPETQIPIPKGPPTGCAGPFVNGVGGWCGCNCKCCPPPGSPGATATMYFRCCSSGGSCQQPCSNDSFECTVTTPGPDPCTYFNGTFTLTWDETKCCYWCDTINTTWCLSLYPSGWELDFGGGNIDPATGNAYNVTVAAYTSSDTSCDSSITLTKFQGGGSCWEALPASITFTGGSSSKPTPNAYRDVQLPEWDQKIPSFTEPRPVSPDGTFVLGDNGSIPCEVIPVEVKCASVDGCCGLQTINGKIVAVGNGYVTATTPISADNGCGEYDVTLNGATPPVWVNDGDIITVELISTGSGCTCTPIGTEIKPIVRLWKKLTDRRTGKMKINPKTGKPRIVLDKGELLRRIQLRQERLKKQQLRRRKK